MSEDDISHMHGLDYSKDPADARDAVRRGRADAAFFMRATPVEQVREVAEAGESMPPEVDLLLSRRSRPGWCSTRSSSLNSV